MDRYEWLKCQSWLLPCADGCLVDVEWWFEGFASFYTSSNSQQQVGENEALSEKAAYLFFSVQQASSLDPAQLALKLGVARPGTPMLGSDVVLSFDNGNYFHLDFKQVLAIVKWEQEQGCKICRELNYLTADVGRRNACACQLLPPYVIVQLKHVSMIVYQRNWSSESSLPQILSAIDVLCEAFEEKNISKCHGATHKGARKIESTLCDSEKTANLSDIHSLSKQFMQQFLTELECMSKCALAATNCCNADVPWMIRLLHIMMQHAAADKEQSLQSKPLQCHLQSYLFSLEDEEQRHISSICATNSTQQQEAKAGAVIALQHTMEKRKQTEEAMLWLELLNSSTVID